MCIVTGREELLRPKHNILSRRYSKLGCHQGLLHLHLGCLLSSQLMRPPLHLIFTFIVYLDWQFFDQVLSKPLTLVVLESHSSCPLSINVPRDSILLDERLCGSILNLEYFTCLSNAQILFCD